MRKQAIVALFACGVSLLMAERELSGTTITNARMPSLCRASLLGTGAVLVFTAITCRPFFLNQSIPVTVIAVIPITAFFVRRLTRRGG